jgi:flagellar basal-body rod protein FlgB
MSIAGMPLFAALKQKMQWHQARQSLLAENVANADTPGYHGHDLKAFDVAEAGNSSVTLRSTTAGHLSLASQYGGFAVEPSPAFEVTPDGNDVGLEEQMMKVTENQMDYQTVTTLYTRSLKLIRTALGRSA